MKELSDKDRISIRFMSVPNKRGQVFFEARASKIKSDSDKFLILLDFRHIDEIVKEECERREKLESALKLAKFNNDIIFAISKIYFLIYRIDIIADCFEEISSGSAEHRLTGKKAKRHLSSDRCAAASWLLNIGKKQMLSLISLH